MAIHARIRHRTHQHNLQALRDWPTFELKFTFRVIHRIKMKSFGRNERCESEVLGPKWKRGERDGCRCGNNEPSPEAMFSANCCFRMVRCHSQVVRPCFIETSYNSRQKSISGINMITYCFVHDHAFVAILTTSVPSRLNNPAPIPGSTIRCTRLR